MTIAPKQGEWLLSPKGKMWKVESIAALRDPIYTLRSERGAHRGAWLREIANWERAPLWMVQAYESKP